MPFRPKPTSANAISANAIWANSHFAPFGGRVQKKKKTKKKTGQGFSRMRQVFTTFLQQA